MKSKGILIWCNVQLLAANKGKCVIAVSLGTEKESYKLLSNSSLMIDEPNWKELKNKPGWYYRFAEKDEITIFN